MGICKSESENKLRENQPPSLLGARDAENEQTDRVGKRGSLAGEGGGGVTRGVGSRGRPRAGDPAGACARQVGTRAGRGFAGSRSQERLLARPGAGATCASHLCRCAPGGTAPNTPREGLAEAEPPACPADAHSASSSRAAYGDRAATKVPEGSGLHRRHPEGALALSGTRGTVASCREGRGRRGSRREVVRADGRSWL